MARIRTIKPEFFTSETLAQLTLAQERSFAGLLTQADDKGRLRNQPGALNGALWPERPEHSTADMAADIDAIVALGLLCKYTGPDGKAYLHFPSWDEHQKISHPSTRNLNPACPTHDSVGGLPLPAEPDPNVLFERDLIGHNDHPVGDASPARTSSDKDVAPKAAPRASKKSPAKHNTGSDRESSDDSEADPMGVYDTPVPAFTDLREQGAVKRGGRKVGKNGVDPKYREDVETVILKFVDARGRLGIEARVADSWWTDIQSLLRGTETRGAFTVGQVCDLIDWVVTDSFWANLVAEPKALIKHGWKLYAGDDFVQWSLSNNRPAENRPRNHVMKATGPRAQGTGPLAAPRGQIAADIRWSSDTPRDGRL